MQDFLTRFFALVTSVEFIVGTLICGLILSIAGAALYDWGKALLGRVSAKQRAKNEKEEKQIEKAARRCVENPSYLTIRVGDGNYWLIAGWGNLITGWIGTVLSLLIAMIVYRDSFSKLLDSDAIQVLGTMGVQPPYILRIPVTQVDLWFRILMLGMAISILFIYRRGYILFRRSRNSRRVTTRAWDIIYDQMEATQTDQNGK